MLAALIVLQLSLGQADARAPVAVVITSKRPGAEAVAPKIAQRVYDSFKREGVKLLDDAAARKELKAAGFSDPKSCQGTRACLSKLAILLGPRAVVVGVDVGKVGKTLAIHLEAVAADEEKSLATLDVSSALDGWSDAMSAPIVVFVRDVKASLAPSRPPPPPEPEPVVAKRDPVVDDAPRRTDLTPAPKEPTPAEAVTQRPPRPLGAPIAFAAGAGVAAAAAVVTGVLAASDKAAFDASLVTLPGGGVASTLPEAQARALADGANLKTTLAISSGGLALALAVVSTVLFLKN